MHRVRPVPCVQELSILQALRERRRNVRGLQRTNLNNGFNPCHVLLVGGGGGGGISIVTFAMCLPLLAPPTTSFNSLSGRVVSSVL
jgi:hypothetical protein